MPLLFLQGRRPVVLNVSLTTGLSVSDCFRLSFSCMFLWVQRQSALQGQACGECERLRAQVKDLERAGGCEQGECEQLRAQVRDLERKLWWYINVRDWVSSSVGKLLSDPLPEWLLPADLGFRQSEADQSEADRRETRSPEPTPRPAKPAPVAKRKR